MLGMFGKKDIQETRSLSGLTRRENDMERVIPVEWVEKWIENHDNYLPTRYVKFMLQDWKFEAYGETHGKTLQDEFQEWLALRNEGKL